MTRGDFRAALALATLEHPVRSNCLAVVPAYNEEESLGSVLAGLKEHAPELDVVVVDDGSTDNTSRLARAHGVSVLRHPFNLGIGGAVQSGFRYALENGYDYCVQIDGDGQH